MGIAHQREALPCQDMLGHRCCENGNRVLAVSDGAGSARFAREAANTNVNALLDYFERVPLTDFLNKENECRVREILDACIDTLIDCSGEHENSMLADFAATLIFFVSNGESWAAGHLGDGYLLVQDAGGEVLLSSEPENAGRSNRTYFTLSPDAADHLHITCRAADTPVPDLILMTSDGISPMFRTRRGSDYETAAEILQYVRQGYIRNNADLADALNQMVIYPIDRIDDWSVLIWSNPERFDAYAPAPVVSMLEVEENRFSEKE